MKLTNWNDARPHRWATEHRTWDGARPCRNVLELSNTTSELNVATPSVEVPNVPNVPNVPKWASNWNYCAAVNKMMLLNDLHAKPIHQIDLPRIVKQSLHLYFTSKNSVKPVYKDHQRGTEIVVLNSRWSLWTGSLTCKWPPKESKVVFIDRWSL